MKNLSENLVGVVVGMIGCSQVVRYETKHNFNLFKIRVVTSADVNFKFPSKENACNKKQLHKCGITYFSLFFKEQSHF